MNDFHFWGLFVLIFVGFVLVRWDTHRILDKLGAWRNGSATDFESGG